MSLDRTSARFETTSWTLIEALAASDDSQRQAALCRLVELYWPAVYGFLRRRGQSQETAAEATQAFFADVVLWRGLFEQAEKERGRLRTLVLAALRRHQIDLARRAEVRSRRGRPDWAKADLDGDSPLSPLPIPEVDEVERELQRDGELNPEGAFFRNWAAALMSEARRRCEEYFLHRGRRGHWAVFEARVLRPAVAAVAPPALAVVAAQHGFATPADAAAAVQAVKKRMLAILREVVAETTRSPADAEAEYRWLMDELG